MKMKPDPIINLKAVAEQLSYPHVLRNGGKPLVQEVLEAAVIGADDELPRPELRPPMPDNLDEADKFALVRSKLGMFWGNRATEERDRSVSLMKHRAKARAGGVTVDDEGLVEVRQLKARRRHESLFERVEGRCCRRCPLESFPLKEGRQWRRSRG